MDTTTSHLSRSRGLRGHAANLGFCLQWEPIEGVNVGLAGFVSGWRPLGKLLQDERVAAWLRTVVRWSRGRNLRDIWSEVLSVCGVPAR